MMDQARSAFSTLFRGEPLSYTRFSLARQVDGDNSHVEMKLAADEEESVDNNVGGNHASVTKPKRLNGFICYGTIAVVLFFLIGFMIGYLGYCKRVEPKAECERPSGTESLGTEGTEPSETEEYFPETPSRLFWTDLKTMLSERLSNTNFLTTIRLLNENSYVPREAGSQKDESLAFFIENQFRAFLLSKIWRDEHFVKIQVKSSSAQNSVTIVGTDSGVVYLVESPEGYVAYSKAATVTGRLVHANFGTKEDFENLNSPVNGSLVIVRAGKITFAEKVANAQSFNAIGVLIYMDQARFPIVNAEIPVFGHH